MSEIDVLIEGGNWSDIPDLEAIVRHAVAAVLAKTGEGGDVSVLLTNDAAIRVLNAQFRNLDKPTNVLSFPAAAMPGEETPALGDIALAFETCAREAGGEGKSLANHLSHLVVHGMLHLLGHDHESDEEAEDMEALETAILAGLGIADPYAGTEPAGTEPAGKPAT